jgi:nicotinamidase-related amidase
MDTIVLCGIATDFGVESTARFAYEYGLHEIFAEDAMASRSDEQHNAAVNFISKEWVEYGKQTKFSMLSNRS